MCLSQYLLVLASTLPIGMAMGGPRGPEEQSDSLMNPSVPRQHSQGINELARRARHGSQGLLALSTLAAALVLSFLIFRCFIALHPRVNNKDSRVNLRRLAYYIPDVCSPYTNLTEEREDKNEEKKWKKIGLLFGAGALITGLATMAASYLFMGESAVAPPTNNNNNINKLNIDFLNLNLNPTATASPEMLETIKARLGEILPPPRPFLFWKGKTASQLQLPVERFNPRILNYFLSLNEEKGLNYNARREDLAKFARYHIDMALVDIFGLTDITQASNEVQAAAQRIENDYAARFGLLTTLARDLGLGYEPAKSQAKARLTKLLPSGTFKFTNEKGDESTLQLPVARFNRRLVTYFTVLNQEDLADEAMTTELKKFANYYLHTMLTNMTLDKTEAAKAIKEEYEAKIDMMVHAKNLREIWRRRARATEEAVKYVTPTVANTVKAIEEGTFRLFEEFGSGSGQE